MYFYTEPVTPYFITNSLHFIQIAYIYKFAFFFGGIYNVIVRNKQRQKAVGGGYRRKDEIMGNSTGYELRHADRAIIVSDKFAKSAGKMGSVEYTQFIHLRMDYPDYTVRQRKNKNAKPHQTYARLNYDKMEALISEWTGSQSAEAEEFLKVKAQAHLYAGSYGIVKKWFLENYGERYKAHIVSETDEQ